MGNFSKNPQDVLDEALTKGYNKVRFQQGKPLIDRELNLLADLTTPRRLAAAHLGNGVAGAEDFLVTGTTRVNLPFFVKVRKGRCLVNGYEIILSEDATRTDMTFPVDQPRHVYLRASVGEVDAGEDSNLNNEEDVEFETSIREKVEWTIVATPGEITSSDHLLLAVITKRQSTIGIGFKHEIEDRRRILNLSQLTDEIVQARGDTNMLGERLDTSLTGDGALKESSVGAAQIVNGSVGKDELADNSVGTSQIENNAVTSDKIANGTVGTNEIGNDTVSEAKLSTSVRGKLVTNGDSHDHSGGDGALIRHSSLNKNDGTNPHGTTANDVGAIAKTGGTINGALRVTTTIGFSSYFRAGQGFNGLIAGVGKTSRSSGWVAGVEGQAFGTIGYGVAASSVTGNYALFVSGTARFTGAKTGYVVDTFINASGQTLKTGDVVKLKGTSITRFYGENNKVPVPEVILSDQEDDNKVIGIVSGEAIPDQDVPDDRVGPDDPTFIDDGGELFVVTLGTFAHCKVDAASAPIEVGDLLTTSSNPGYAKKATDPQIGCIIGKALEPLKEGTGYISVFVNIQ